MRKISPPELFYVMADPIHYTAKNRLSNCNSLMCHGLHENYVVKRKFIPAEFLYVCNVFEGQGPEATIKIKQFRRGAHSNGGNACFWQRSLTGKQLLHREKGRRTCKLNLSPFGWIQSECLWALVDLVWTFLWGPQAKRPRGLISDSFCHFGPERPK